MKGKQDWVGFDFPDGEAVTIQHSLHLCLYIVKKEEAHASAETVRFQGFAENTESGTFSELPVL